MCKKLRVCLKIRFLRSEKFCYPRIIFSHIVNNKFEHQINNDDNIFKPKNHHDYIVYNDDNEYESDEDGEYEETLEEGIPCEPPHDKEYYKHQNNRYACPKVILETVEQESEEGTTIKYFSQKSKVNEKEDFHSVKLNNNSLAQIPVDSSINNERSQAILKSSFGK